MADHTGIEWTDSTWNPIVGCSIVSKGCTNCYAMRTAGSRTRHTDKYRGLTQPSKAGPVWTGEVRFWERALLEPLKWREPRRIFVNSMGDLFAEGVPDEWIDRVFAVMALCPQHTFQVLTKRPERMREWFAERWQGTPAIKIGDLDIPAGGETGRRSQIERACEPFLQKLGLVDTTRDELWTEDGKCKAMQWAWPLPNVWLGVSAEDQATADERIPLLLDTPATIRFVSAEPLLGPIDLRRIQTHGGWYDALSGWRNVLESPPPEGCLDQVIVGGETGPRARPMHLSWARSLRDQCVSAGVAFFFKQHGAWEPTIGEVSTHWVSRDGRLLEVREPFAHGVRNVGKNAAGRLLDGREWNEYPGATA